MTRLLAAFAASFLIAATIFPREALARKKQGPGFGLRARVEGAYGWVNYDSQSVITNATTSVSGNEWGGRAEAELWATRLLGVVVEGEHIAGDLSQTTAQTFQGKPISQEAAAVSAGFRVIGSGGEGESELALIAGAQMGFYSDVRAYLGSSSYDLVRANTYGGRFGARARLALSNTMFLDAMAAYYQPVNMVGVRNSELDKKGSRSVTGTLAVEYRNPATGIGVGAGAFIQRNRLEYRARPDLLPQEIDFNLAAPMVYVRFSL